MGAIIDPHELMPLANGVRAGVIRMDAANRLHRNALMQTIYNEALVHGEELFNKAAFAKVIHAARANKIHAYFLVVSMELCDPKIAGAAIQIPTAILKQRGSHIVAVPGEHGEDTSLCQSLSKIVRELTATEENPGGIRLGTWFTQERIRLSMTDPACMPFGMVSGGRTGEHWIDNIPITKLYKKFNKTLGTRDTPILQLNGLTPEILDRARRTRIPVELEELATNNQNALSNIFLTRRTESNGELALSFTESMSTFQGHPVVRVNAKSIGNLLNKEALKDTLASKFFVGSERVSELQWDIGDNRNAFGGKVPVMLIHAPGEIHIVNALQEMGVKVRKLDDCLMVPSVMDFDDLPENMHGEPARPFSTVGTSDFANRVYYDFGRAVV